MRDLFLCFAVALCFNAPSYSSTLHYSRVMAVSVIYIIHKFSRIFVVQKQLFGRMRGDRVLLPLHDIFIVAGLEYLVVWVSESYSRKRF